MEQIGKPRNKSTYMYLIDLCPGCQEYMRKNCFKQMLLEKLNMHIKKRKKETGPLPHTTHKNQLKVDSRLKPKT